MRLLKASIRMGCVDTVVRALQKAGHRGSRSPTSTAQEVRNMTEQSGGRPEEAPHKATCRVCLKRIGPDEKKWTVHWRGTEYLVCCPSCVQAFNRAPQQYGEEP